MIEFSYYDDFSISASTYLSPGKYTVSLNYLEPGGLLKECWQYSDYSGPKLTSGKSLLTGISGNSCRWEGYFKAPADELEFQIGSDDYAYVWIGDDRNIKYLNTWPISETFTVKLVKNQLTYIKIEVNNRTGGFGFFINWRKVGVGGFRSFTGDMLYYPKRPIWNTLTLLEDREVYYYTNESDSGYFYCPYPCAACNVDNIGNNDCLSCKEGVKDCKCDGGYVLDTLNYQCLPCPELCEECVFKYLQATCVRCAENSIALGHKCTCPTDYYYDYIKGACISSSFLVSVSLISIQDKSHVILELSNSCTQTSSYLCDDSNFNLFKINSEFTASKEYYTSSMILPSDSEYAVSIILLLEGGLLYEEWSDNYNKAPSYSDILTFEDFVPSSNNNTARFTGYIQAPASGEFILKIVSNIQYEIYIQDDTQITQMFTANEIHCIFTLNKFYPITINLASSIDSYLYINWSYDQGLTYDSITNYLRYPKRFKNSIYKVNPSEPYIEFSANDDDLGIQLCPYMSTSCQQLVVNSRNAKISQVYYSVQCINFSELIDGECKCIDDYKFSTISQECELIEGYVSEVFVECIYPFKLRNGICICDTDENIWRGVDCIEKEFRLSIETEMNKFSLIFSKYLARDLEISDIELSSSTNILRSCSSDLTTMTERKSYSYEIYCKNSIRENFEFTLFLNSSIQDQSHHFLTSYEYDFNLEIYHSTQSNNDDDTRLLYKEYSRYVAASSIITAGGLGILENNSYSFLLVVSTIQLISFLPLYSTELPYRFQAICEGCNILSLIPNELKDKLSYNTKPKPSNFKEYNHEAVNTIFITNKLFLSLLSLLSIYLFVRQYHGMGDLIKIVRYTDS